MIPLKPYLSRITSVAILVVLLLAMPAMGESHSAVPSGEMPGEGGDSLKIDGDSLIDESRIDESRRVPQSAGRKITPVESDDRKPPQPVLHYYDKHGNPLKEPVLFLSELDTVSQVKSGPVYPLLNSMSIGVNFFDAVMLACGQKHAGFDIWADLSLHNWFFPVVEFGVGFADNKPEDGNFHYKGKPSFYGKVGLNYNFLYKSDPAYQVYLGLRGGYTHFEYDITDITVSSPYWDQQNKFSIMDQKASVFYGEVLAGLKVKIVKNFYMGWNVKVHFKLHSTPGANSTPWYIPGYGTSGLLNASFSLIYTLPLSQKSSSEDTPPGL